ncbi:MAG: septum site-determining protein MinC [Betaproteobacteria bacterium]
MTTSSSSNAPLHFEIKSANLPLVSFLVRTADLNEMSVSLETRFANSPDFFDNDAVVIDLNPLNTQPGPIDLQGLCQLLRRYRMNPVAVKASHEGHLATATLAGLFIANEARTIQAPAQQAIIQEVVKEVIREVPAPALSALVVDKPLRSGQQVYARGRDLVVMAMVNPGAEVMSDGHIHIYAPLRGKAIAGAKGDASARIFTQSLEAELISIAGIYKTSETGLPDNVRSKPAQIFLKDDKLVMLPL